jgi:hypothetical protein
MNESDKKQTSLLIHGIKHGMKKVRKMARNKDGVISGFMLDDSEDEETFGESTESRFLKRLIERGKISIIS